MWFLTTNLYKVILEPSPVLLEPIAINYLTLMTPNNAARPKITKPIPTPKNKIVSPPFHILLLGYDAYQESVAIEVIFEWKNTMNSPNKTKNNSKSNSISSPVTYVPVSALITYSTLRKSRARIHKIRSMKH